MQKHANLADLVKSFPPNIFLQNLASIQKRTSPIKFAHLAEKSESGSISNLSIKVSTWPPEVASGRILQYTLDGVSFGGITESRQALATASEPILA